MYKYFYSVHWLIQGSFKSYNVQCCGLSLYFHIYIINSSGIEIIDQPLKVHRSPQGGSKVESIYPALNVALP